mgnify:CR=1 FL=1
MRLTTKGRLAVTAMIDLAMRQHNGPVTLAGISQRQRISLSYLEQGATAPKQISVLREHRAALEIPTSTLQPIRMDGARLTTA